MLDNLKYALNNLISISQRDCESLASLFKIHVLKENDIFFHSFSLSDHVIFLEDGLITKTFHISIEKKWISLFYEQNNLHFLPSENRSNGEFIEKINCIGTVKFFSISKTDLENWFKNSKVAFKFFLKLEEKYSDLLENRLFDLMEIAADDRLLLFEKSYPKIFQRINSAQIANHLGITPQHLCRLNKNKHYKNNNEARS